MLDIKYIKQNKKQIEEGIKNKNADPHLIDELIKQYDIWTNKLQPYEKLRQERNKISKHKGFSAEGKEIKEKLVKAELEVVEAHKEYLKIEAQIPNPPLSDVPVGKSESDNKEIRKSGKIPKFDFEPKDHVVLGTALDIFDFERGSKVTGSDFYYLKNEAVSLELALVSYGVDFLTKKGFIPYITPDLAHAKFYEGTGYNPKGPEAQTYKIEDSDLGLIATAEITLAGLHADETLAEKDMPRKYGGYSHCFRKESGSYGKYSKGLYRVHQFTKVEMFVYCQAEDSNRMHQELLGYEEEFWSSLKIPYRVLEMCTGDLGAQAAKKFDLEAWMPGRGDYGEITSTSNTTDYQARRLNIKYKKENSTEYVHTLNGTLVATSRAIIAILENYQQKDGSIEIPKVLQKYTGFEKVPQ